LSLHMMQKEKKLEKKRNLFKPSKLKHTQIHGENTVLASQK